MLNNSEALYNYMLDKIEKEHATGISEVQLKNAIPIYIENSGLDTWANNMPDIQDKDAFFDFVFGETPANELAMLIITAPTLARFRAASNALFSMVKKASHLEYGTIDSDEATRLLCDARDLARSLEGYADIQNELSECQRDYDIIMSDCPSINSCSNRLKEEFSERKRASEAGGYITDVLVNWWE